MSSGYVLTLNHPNADLATVGGKGMSLAKMAGVGLPVPGGFHVATAAYRCFVEENGLQMRILDALKNADITQPENLEAISGGIRDAFERGTIPAEIEMAVGEAYHELSRTKSNNGHPQASGDLAVAVRSSATAEDLPEASFAGQQETYLNVRGTEAVLEAVKKCWASLWTARAIAYRMKNGVDAHTVALAVVVQELVAADAAGIMFTANPINGRRDELVINAAWGLGEAVVSGAVTPDTITVNRATGRVIERKVADKAVMTVRTGRGTQEQPVPADRKKKAVLSDAQAVELARLGVKIEEYYGMPMDVEWTLTKQPGTAQGNAGSFAIVQARPITALPPEWKRPHPKAIYARGSLAEHLPNPVTPLFGTLGLRAVNQATAELGDMLGIDPIKIEYQYRAINGYVFMGFLLSGKVMWSMIVMGLKNWRLMLKEGIQRWKASGEEMGKVLARWEERDVTALSPVELLEGSAEIFTQLGRLYTVMQSGTLPAASSSEILFNRVYGMAKRKGDPEATTFLFGFDTAPMLAEKSLFDLAMYVKEHAALEEAIRTLPTDGLVAALNENAAPGGVLPQDWLAWKARFESHLRVHGATVYELDFANPTPAETPALLLETIKMYLTGRGQNPYERQRAAMEEREQATQKMLARLRWPLKGWFEKSLKWAQLAGPGREDSLMDLGMANPQMRRMLGELGRRFAANGAIERADDIYWLLEDEAAELAAKLEKGEELPELRALVPVRKAAWQAQLKITPPAMLPEKSGWAKLIPWHKTGQTGNILIGSGASAGKVTAPACVLLSPEDFSKMKPGAVLVAVTTTPAWTPLFAMASAIVTDIGGPLSHSSIVAREYGIPAVLATGNATRRIQNGQTVSVDGGAGTVVLE